MRVILEEDSSKAGVRVYNSPKKTLKNIFNNQNKHTNCIIYPNKCSRNWNDFACFKEELVANPC